MSSPWYQSHFQTAFETSTIMMSNSTSAPTIGNTADGDNHPDKWEKVVVSGSGEVDRTTLNLTWILFHRKEQARLSTCMLIHGQSGFLHVVRVNTWTEWFTSCCTCKYMDRVVSFMLYVYVNTWAEWFPSCCSCKYMDRVVYFMLYV
jgi:hypothetical protein